MDQEAQEAGSGRVDDRELVRRLLAGDKAAFEVLADAYIPAVYRFAARRLGPDQELVRDVVQTTLVNAIARLDSFRGEAALLTWLCACCKSEISAHRRRRVDAPLALERSADVVAPEEGPEQAVLREETADLVHAALDLLPVHHSRALEWKYLEGLPVKQIADRLNLGSKAAESLLTRARSSFRETFARLASRGPAPRKGWPR